jgi:hypothetical protein
MCCTTKQNTALPKRRKHGKGKNSNGNCCKRTDSTVFGSRKRNVYTTYTVNNPTLYMNTDLVANYNYSEESNKIKTQTIIKLGQKETEKKPHII